MNTRYITTTSILNGKPGDAVVHDTDTDRWLIVNGTLKRSEARTKQATPIIERLQGTNPQASLADVLAAYISNHSYSKATGWLKSPDDFDGTVEWLSDMIVGAERVK